MAKCVAVETLFSYDFIASFPSEASLTGNEANIFTYTETLMSTICCLHAGVAVMEISVLHIYEICMSSLSPSLLQ